MADQRCFVSFETEINQSDKELFLGQIKCAEIPFILEDWSPKSALPQSYRKELSLEKIKSSDFMVVLVSRHMGAAQGVVDEIALAKKYNVPVFGIYVGSASTSSILPEGMHRKRVIRWNWELINRALKKVLTEGKNK